MALKFLNKKGWHTGSLRNIENVWKAEQKHEAEQKKLEELRVQIQQERERSEFRALQEQAGLVPRQERLDFLYDSGLSVGKGGASTSGSGVSFQALEQPAKADTTANNNNNNQQPSVPGALFEDKPHSANDVWRKLHSDPLLLIRQREQEALARVKNNPVQMALIRKSVEEKKPKVKNEDKKAHKKNRHHSSSKHRKQSSSKHHSDSEEDTRKENERRKSNHHRVSRVSEMRYDKTKADSEDEPKKREGRREIRGKEKYSDRSPSRHLERENAKDDELKKQETHREVRHMEKYRDQSPSRRSERENVKGYGQDNKKRTLEDTNHEKYTFKGHKSTDPIKRERENGISDAKTYESKHKYRSVAPKLSEEERAAKLRQMQMDAELHDEQRWKRLKKAEDADAQEAKQNRVSGGRNFLDAAHKSVYGAEKGGSSTIGESVRRRTHYSQRGSEAEGNAFRR